MKFSIKLLAALAGIVCTAAAVDENPAVASADSAVVKLTSDKFSAFLKENDLVLAEFFAPWCGHCKHLGPEFSSAADRLLDKNIRLAQIDCTVEKDLCQNHGIKGYPTLKVFKGPDAEPVDYSGQRTADSIYSYMLKQSLPPVSVIADAADLTDSIEEAVEPIVLQIQPKGAKASEANTSFYELAGTLREQFTFIVTSSDEYIKKYAGDSSEPVFAIFRADSSEPSIFKGEVSDLTHLTEFIEIETKPLFGEIDGSSFQVYMGAKLPLAYYFWTDKAGRDAVESIILPLAKKYRGVINFVGLEAAKFGPHAKNLNMQESYPLFAIHDIESNKKYGISQEKELNNKDITKFVESFVAGEAEPIVKSEDVPEEQAEAVYHLVGKEHQAITLDESKDVLVKYYAPWCGHCKRLAPTYEELAAVYKDAGEDRVVIAKLDHTLNDVPVEISGYPTLVLYPANDKTNPITFEGARSIEGLSEFIKDKGSFGIDALKLQAENTAAGNATEEAVKEADGHDEL
ncbi:unnamed protein product [Kuraishia capsulata CBS 1993]|uniref:protein disulfide-isomerase n=1 Tax=Kuraishia capsulata CBS 1993 TaxID=1382522 RepID=W6MT59_9ASCO|nr:uncharacterized protein KUCA_T00005923001 [Kuraishia capsulata CBS 1993]CDK29929.1 unnamed protein product [Kuraishia capsulata CBS 1993]